MKTYWRLSSGGSCKRFGRQCSPSRTARQSLFEDSFNHWSGWGLMVALSTVGFREKSVMLVATAVAATQRVPHAVTERQPIEHKSKDII